jgi:phage-related protein
MAFLTFPSITPTDDSPGRSVEHRTYSAQFGDGFEQVAAAGINTVILEWDLSWKDQPHAEADQIIAFLEARGAHEPFWWTPPPPYSGSAFLVRCESHKETEWMPQTRDVSAKFKRWYGAEE